MVPVLSRDVVLDTSEEEKAADDELDESGDRKRRRTVRIR